MLRQGQGRSAISWPVDLLPRGRGNQAASLSAAGIDWPGSSTCGCIRLPEVCLMRRILVLIVLLYSCCGIANAAPTQNVTEHPDWKAYFDEAGVTGTCVVYSFKDDRYHVWNLDRASRRFAPASTSRSRIH